MLAAEVIADRDPKEIVIMVGPKDVPSSAMRLAGNEKVLKERHLDYQLFQTQSYKFELAEQTAHQFFETFPQADSVIASNDVYAIALMKEATKRGQRIPEEFQIIGYDDMPFSRMMYPGLSTIAQPAYEMGYKGAELLCDILEKGFVENGRIQLPVTLKIRESVRKKDKDE